MNCSPSTILLIGYGNELRGDDAVGPMVAQAIDNLKSPGVKTLIQHQLTPELAEPISQARAVIFIDATLDPSPSPVLVRPIEPGDSNTIPVHTGDPRTLLALTLAVFSLVPPAWWVTIPIASTQFGESLTAQAHIGMTAAVNEVKHLIAQTGRLL